MENLVGKCYVNLKTSNLPNLYATSKTNIKIKGVNYTIELNGITTYFFILDLPLKWFVHFFFPFVTDYSL